MSSKPKARVKAMRVKLTRDPPTDSTRLERVATEPDYRLSVIRALRDDRPRDLSASVEALKLQGGSSEGTLLKLVAASGRALLRTSLQASDRGWLDPRAKLARSRLSLVVPNEDRKSDAMYLASQCRAPSATGCYEKLEVRPKSKRLAEELKDAQETIAQLRNETDRLSSEVQRLTATNTHLAEVVSPAVLATLQQAVRDAEVRLDSQYSHLASQLENTESRFDIVQSRVKSCLADTLHHLAEANDCLKQRKTEEETLQKEVVRLRTLLGQVQDYAELHISTLEVENEHLREENIVLEKELRNVITERDVLDVQLTSLVSRANEAEQAASLRQQLTTLTEDLETAHSLVRLQRVEIKELRKEVDSLSSTASVHASREQSLMEAVQRMRVEIKEMQEAYKDFEDELRSGNMRKTMEMVHRERRRLAQSLDIDNQSMGGMQTVREMQPNARCISPHTPEPSPPMEFEDAVTSPSEDAQDADSEKAPVDLRTAVLALLSELPAPQPKHIEKLISSIVPQLQPPEALLDIVMQARRVKLS